MKAIVFPISIIILLGLSLPVDCQETESTGSLELIAKDLDFPGNLIAANDGSGRIFALEHVSGKIKILENGAVRADPFLDIGDLLSEPTDVELGLVGLAFPPDFEKKKHVYIAYTDQNIQLIVSRFKVSLNPLKALKSSEEKLLVLEKWAPYHHCGHMAFGPMDGYLYLCVGDSTNNQSPLDPSQNLQRLHGKILRLEVESGDKPYGIPPDNPFAGKKDVRPEIWVYGLRNPWRFSFDSLTGDLYIPDIGFKSWEELNIQSATSRGGENYGWRLAEGNMCRSECAGENISWPIYEYPYQQVGCAIIGGAVYRGEKTPEWQGVYVFADNCNGEIWGFRWNEGVPQIRTLFTHRFESAFSGDFKATAAASGPDGEIYVSEMLKGGIYRLHFPDRYETGWETVDDLYLRRTLAGKRKGLLGWEMNALKKRISKMEQTRRWRWTQPFADLRNFIREKIGLKGESGKEQPAPGKPTQKP